MPLQIRDIVCPYMQEAIAWRKVQEAALIRSLMPERSLGFLLHKAWRKPIHFLLGKITTAVHLPKELWDHILSFMVAPHAMTQHANVLKAIDDAKTINKSSSAIVLPSTNTDTCVYYLANLGTGYYATNHPNPIIGYLYSRYKQYPAPALVNNDSPALESYTLML